MQTFLYVFVGGGLGASFRFLSTLLVVNQNLKAWVGTLLVNLIGCFFIFLGMKFKFFENEMNNVLLKVGLLGGLTTFSTFSLEVVNSFKTGNIKEGLLILFLNIVFGIAIGIGIFR
jgi:CrcB protein